MNSLETVYRLIDGEREYQARRWPGHSHNVAAYLTYMHRYLHIACEVDSTTGYTNTAHFLYARGAMRKIAALAVACMEDNGVLYRLPPPTVGESIVEFFTGESPVIRQRIEPVGRGLAYLAINQELRFQGWEEEDDTHEFSESLTLLRHRLRVADQAWDLERSAEPVLYQVRIIGAIAVRAIALHGAPRREMPVKVFAA